MMAPNGRRLREKRGAINPAESYTSVKIAGDNSMIGVRHKVVRNRVSFTPAMDTNLWEDFLCRVCLRARVTS